MASLLVTVFLLQLAIHLINTVGASSLNSILWSIWSRLLGLSSNSVAEHDELKLQFLQLRRQLNATSSQDEFAKWAKLRRQHDKLSEKLEKAKISADKIKSKFDTVVTTIRWLGTNGLRMFLQFWYQKQPMFYVPTGWVPYLGEWMLSLPRAPLGSISIQAWSLACSTFIVLMGEVFSCGIALGNPQSSVSGQEGVTPGLN
ncbi:Bgt-2440 [Blumeria graminis f. sp. tritici]|uniref:Bgt-2440 n=2 Tax=Blumeria graminis f. sp. tritici TaxID=62690 RepID=A0A9X9MPY4_BLUGR|nr:Bgt-2440 [Blumeria graminis f. sp. tritici]